MQQASWMDSVPSTVKKRPESTTRYNKPCWVSKSRLSFYWEQFNGGDIELVAFWASFPGEITAKSKQPWWCPARFLTSIFIALSVVDLHQQFRRACLWFISWTSESYWIQAFLQQLQWCHQFKHEQARWEPPIPSAIR